MNHRNLAFWIADPQAVKPGTNMPAVPMNAREREAITAYLETLR
jgi:cytochrome c oxidase subunit 2